MTKNLLENIELKIDSLITEMQELKNQLSQLQQENDFLKSEQTSYSEKLKNLISLLDVLQIDETLAVL